MSGKKIFRVVAISFLLLALVLTPLIAGCGSEDADQDGDQNGEQNGEVKTLTIGAVLMLSGPGGVVGMGYSQGFELAFDRVNEEGGLQIGGDTYMIEFLAEDTRGTPDGATAAVTKLIYQDGAKFIMHQVANDFVQVQEITSEAGVMLVVAYAAFSSVISPGTEIGPEADLAIRLHPSDDEMCSVPIEYLVEAYPDVESVCIMNIDMPGFEIQIPHAEGLLREYGLEPAGDAVTFAMDCMDFQPIVTRVLQSEADSVYVLHAILDQFVMIVKTLREQGFEGPIFYSSPFDGSLVARALPDVTDVFGCGVALDAPNLPEQIQEVIDMGRAKHGDDFASDSISGYEVGMLLAQVIEKAQSTDPAVVLAAFEGMTEPGSLQSLYGPAYVGGLNTLGVNRAIVRPVLICRVVEGEGDYLGVFDISIP